MNFILVVLDTPPAHSTSSVGTASASTRPTPTSTPAPTLGRRRLRPEVFDPIGATGGDLAIVEVGAVDVFVVVGHGQVRPEGEPTRSDSRITAKYLQPSFA